MAITKAIIPTAGFGTRFLPISKTIQKEMLPLLARPFIDYVVEDLIKGGITDLIFVVNEHNQQIRHYFSENRRLYEYLKKMNKLDQYDKVADIHSRAHFTFIRQPDEGAYGTAVPVVLAREHVKHEDAFLVYMGDDFIYSSEGVSQTQQMLSLFEQTGAAGMVTCITKPDSVLHKYGVAQVEERNGATYLQSLVEKPAPGKAPSNLTNNSKYILSSKVFEILEYQELNPASGELYITDTVNALAEKSDVVVYTPQGEYLDGGYPLGWLKANLRVAKDQPELHEALMDYLAEIGF